MRNLKKILALVLALVMSMSLLATANAFEDSKDIDPDFTEAVDVLNALGVFQGYDNGKTFQPQGKITRAEVAAIIYRIVTGDTADKQVKIYKDYNKFDDVTSDKWYAGYVNFCANAEIIKGYSATKFGPQDHVTGYQALAMILRAIGYDKNGEFTGAGWQVQTAAVAKKLGVTDKIVAGTLGTDATREVVAEILFKTILVPQVNYTLAFGYSDFGTDTLGYETFKLVGKADVDDVWGRPSSVWYQDLNGNKKVDVAADYGFVSTAYAPTITYMTAVNECEVASDLNIAKTKDFTTYTNGMANKKNYQVQATDTVGKIGAQGRMTLVYNDIARIVYIDTLLAEVTGVTAVKYDAAGHIRKQAALNLTIYDGYTETINGETVESTHVVELSNTDWEYSVGDMLLVYAVQDANGRIVKDGAAAKHIEYKGYAESFAGAQTTIWIRANQHTIEGETYDDNNRFHHDEAGITANVDFTWYMDAEGNLIGSKAIAATYSYAILKNVRWVVGTPGYAVATIIDAETGAESTVTVKTMDGMEDTGIIAWDPNSNDAAPTYSVEHTKTFNFVNDKAYMSDELLLNGTYNGYALYQVKTLADGTVTLDGAPFIGYKHNATITTNSTYFVGEGGLGDLVYVDDNTVFTVKNADGTYSQYVGKANVPSYLEGTARVFYHRAPNKVADYVYIKAGTPTYAGSSFVMALLDQYKIMEKGSVDYDYAVSALVNGEPSANVHATSTSGWVRTLTAKVGVPHYVTYGPNGDLTDAKEFTTTAQQVPMTATWYVKAYDPQLTGTTLLYNKAVTNGMSYNTATADVYGDYTSLDEITDWSDVNIYVVYTKVDSAERGIATSIYAVNKADGEQDSDKTPEATAVVNYVLNVENGVTGTTTTYTAKSVLKAGNPLLNTAIEYPVAWAVADVQAQNDITFGAYAVVGVASYIETVELGETVNFVFTIRV